MEPAQSPEEQPPDGIPDHQLLRRIGCGSYGEVWIARNVMGTLRAVKIVRRASFQDERPFDREFAGIKKFEPISRTCEGFIDILQVGRNEAAGYFYYIMELADDLHRADPVNPDRYEPHTLAREIRRRGRLEFEECLQLGLTLSSALNRLHQHGLIHRDIKPSNIIFVHGAPKLADIGLVAAIDEARSYVGTEGFIPPEGPGTPQADLYGLGKVLYESGTGKDRQDFPEFPTCLGELDNPGPFLELNEILVRACHGDVSKRYSSARDLHADLTVLISGKSVKRLRLLEQRFSQSRRAAIIGLIALAAAAALYRQFEQQHKQAAEIRQRQVGGHVAHGLRSVDEANLLGALPSLVKALGLDLGSQRDSTHRLRLGAALAQCPALERLWTEGVRVNSVAFSPDGSRIAAALWNGQVQLLNADSGEKLPLPIQHQGRAESASFSGDGRLLVTAGRDGSAIIWELDPIRKRHVLDHQTNEINSARFSPDSQTVLTACESGFVYLWNAVSGNRIFEFKAHNSVVVFAGFDPAGAWFVTASRDSTARIWALKDRQPVTAPLRHSSWVYFASFSSDSRRLVTADFDQKASVWTVPRAGEPALVLRHEDGVRSAVFSPDDRYILTACWDGYVRLFDATTGVLARPNGLFPHSHRVMHAGFSADGRRLVTGCIDGTVRIWDLAGSAIAAPQFRDTFSPDRSRFIISSNGWWGVADALSGALVSARIQITEPVAETTLSRDGGFLLGWLGNTNLADASRLQVWNTATGRAQGPPLPPAPNRDTATVSDDGRYLALIRPEAAEVYDLAAGEPKPIWVQTGTVQAAWAPNQSRLLAVTSNALQVVDLQIRKPLFPPRPHQPSIRYAAFSPDARQIVSCAADGNLTDCTAQRWDAATGQPLGAPLRHRDGVWFASFSEDGRLLVTASEDKTAVIWNLDTGQPRVPPLQHRGQVFQAHFSHDARWVVTASRDKTARVWDAATGEPLTPPFRHFSIVWKAGFVSSDYHFLTVSDFRSAFLWNLPSENRPVHDLMALAQVLSSDAPDGPAALQADWARLRAAYPELFAPSAAEVQSWHLQEALEAEEAEQWAAALFHWNHLVRREPHNTRWSERCRQAQEKTLER